MITNDTGVSTVTDTCLPSHSDRGCRARTRIETALFESTYRPLRQVRVEVAEGLVVLTGVLPSYYLKQIAQEVARRVVEVEVLRNLIEVRGLDWG